MKRSLIRQRGTPVFRFTFGEKFIIDHRADSGSLEGEPAVLSGTVQTWGRFLNGVNETVSTWNDSAEKFFRPALVWDSYRRRGDLAEWTEFFKESFKSSKKVLV